MANEIDIQFQIGGWDRTDAELTSENPTLLQNELYIAKDTMQFALGPGTWNTRKGLYFDFANKRIGAGRAPSSFGLESANGVFFTGSGGAVLQGTPGNGTSGMYQNIVGATSGFLWRLLQDGNAKIIMNYGCPDNLIVGQAVGRVDIGGALAIGSGGQLTVTPGTYATLDVADTGFISLDTSSASIEIQGLANGVNGQPIFVVRTSTNNTLTLRNLHASGTQKLLVCPDEADVAIATRYKDTWIEFGNTWLVRS